MRKMLMLVAVLAGAAAANAELPKEEPRDLILLAQKSEEVLIVKPDGKMIWKADKDTVARLLIEQIKSRDQHIQTLLLQGQQMENCEASVQELNAQVAKLSGELEASRPKPAVKIKPKAAKTDGKPLWQSPEAAKLSPSNTSK